VAAEDGAGTGARFRHPRSLVVEPLTGDAFLLEAQTFAVRKLGLLGNDKVPAGRVSLFAGGQPLAAPKAPKAGVAPAAPGAASEKLTDPQFMDPSEIQMDGAGRIFILDPKANQVKMIHDGKSTTFLEGIATVAPPRPPGEKRPAPAIHMAVRKSNPDALLMVISTYAGTPGHEWQLTVHSAPKTAGYPVITLAEEPRLLAVDSRSRIHVLIPDPASQVCRIRTYDPVESKRPQWDLAREADFGPGAVQANGFGFPEIVAMAPDSKGNLFLADRANGVIWMLREADHGFYPIVGTPGIHLFPGQAAQALDFPILAPTALDVTGDDDLCFASGEAIFQATAPGTAAFPWERGPAPDFKSQPVKEAKELPAGSKAPQDETSQMLLGLRGGSKALAAHDYAQAVNGFRTYLKGGIEHYKEWLDLEGPDRVSVQARIEKYEQVLNWMFQAGDQAFTASASDPDQMQVAKAAFKALHDVFANFDLTRLPDPIQTELGTAHTRLNQIREIERKLAEEHAERERQEKERKAKEREDKAKAKTRRP
jgi:hypothetical protein